VTVVGGKVVVVVGGGVVVVGNVVVVAGKLVVRAAASIFDLVLVVALYVTSSLTSMLCRVVVIVESSFSPELSELTGCMNQRLSTSCLLYSLYLLFSSPDGL